jgi:FKBP-type peptidyl-prolyl cis-trans isomerase
MRYPLFVALALSTAALRAADAPAAAPAAPTPVPAAPAAAVVAPATAEQAFKVQGFYMVQQLPLSGMVTELGMSDADIDFMLAGMRLAIKGQELGFKPESIGPALNAFFQARVAANAPIVAAAREAKAKEATAVNTAFFAKLDADTTVTKTASGLRYRILAPGTDPKPTAASTVKALYTGKLTDGTVFDSTDKNGGEPLEFSLGGVIRGWTEGLQLIGKGGKIHLWVPSELGYGAQGGGPIPANSVLEFDVELVEFK